ncbi:MAG: hypothetical protein PHD86_09155 [Kiritimatiellae bacterium]|nr:hypothetical protein [Kiritimatiellia bacterium]
MGEIDKSENRQQIITRLTALWGLTEAGLGGVIHALKIPFTGIVVGSTAIILITLIAFFAERRISVLLKSMIVVLIIKASVSPHTPIPAYFAVLFQGLLASFLFRWLPGIRLPAMTLGILALLEGVGQKFIVMTLIYGKSVWEAIDVIGQKLSAQWGLSSEMENASFWLIAIFTVYYLIGGVIVGWLAGRIPSRVQRMLEQYREAKPDLKIPDDAIRLPEKARRKWPLRRLLPGLLILLMIVFVFGGMQAGEGSARAKCIYVLVRTTVVLAVWFFLVGPLIRKLIARLQKREAMVYGEEIARAMNLMPRLRQMAALAWAQTAFEKKHVRWYRFLLRLIVYSIVCDD